MASKITEECISCGACEGECPTEAISMGDEIYVVDPNLCTECVGFDATRKCAETCPVQCCVLDPENHESEEALFARARALRGNGANRPELSSATSHFRAGAGDRPAA